MTIKEMEERNEKEALLKRVKRIEDTFQEILTRLETAKDFTSFKGAIGHLFRAFPIKVEPE